MKRNILIVTLIFLIHAKTTAQLLYKENFDGLKIGNVGTDLSGINMGQGGLLTFAYGYPGASDNDFRIELEPNRGKVLVINGAKTNLREESVFRIRTIKKNGLKGLWQARDIQNNILKYEYYFFTEKSIYKKNREVKAVTTAADKCALSDLSFDGYKKMMDFGFNTLLSLAPDSWVKIITYIDFTTSDIYFEIPSYNYVTKSKLILPPSPGDIHEIDIILLTLQGDDNFFESYEAKFDDITISAINTLPKLEVININPSKFNIYPNPSNSRVYIASKENMEINEIVIMDLNGKTVKQNSFYRENTVEVDISNLSSGIYLFYITTDAGRTIAKVVKE